MERKRLCGVDVCCEEYIENGGFIKFLNELEEVETKMIKCTMFFCC